MRVTFDLPGLPPTKGEALSMFSPKHPSAARVVTLLEAARDAGANDSELRFASGSICLDVTVTSPSPPPSDATNYLGGIGDVLEDKSRRSNLEHLGSLAQVALYANDSQIDEVHFRTCVGEPQRYRVELSTLGAEEPER